MYPKKYLEKFGEGKKQKPVTIRVEGKRLIPVFKDAEVIEELAESAKDMPKTDKPMLAEVQVEEINGDSWLELKPEYFELDGDVDIMYDSNSFPLITQGLMLTKLQEFMNFAMPFWQNPALFDAPGATDTFVSYLTELSPKGKEKIIDQLKRRSGREDIELANEQTTQLINGMNVPGRPGESSEHIMVHISPLMELTYQIIPAAKSEEEKMAYLEVAQSMMEHIITDSAPRGSEVQAAGKGLESLLSKLQPKQPAQPSQEPDPAAMEQMMQEAMGGGVPEGAGMDIQGQVPMGAV